MFRFALSCALFAFSASVCAAGNTKTFCEHPTDRGATGRANIEIQKLVTAGYSIQDSFLRKAKTTYVGTGLHLEMDTKGVIAVGALPGSPAEGLGMFGKIAYRVMAVDGDMTAGKSLDDVASLVRGKAGTGVVLTFKRESGDRTYDRFLEQKSIARTVEISCVRMAPPKK